ncbi:MAG: hypothetical protein R3318_07570, partial [Gammaproteobacteria bacterium]|nr:hypothetical protein [Gammaproteobacteria bacterium]
MNISIRMALLCLLITTLASLPVRAGQDYDLGRLFLTSKERAILEKMRTAEPEPEEPVVVEEIPEPVDPDEIETGELPEIVLEPEPVLTEPLVLKGVVKRSNGKNAAWLNNTNTIEGKAVMEQVRIHETDINEDGVKIRLPDNVTEITLKVGQTY